MQGGQMVAAETTAAETTAAQRMQWRAKSWGSIMFQPVSMAKKIQESGSYFFSFVLNPCFPVRLNFHSRLPLHITLLTFLLASILGHVVGRSQGSKFCMRDCFTNTSGIQYFNNVSIIFCNRCEHCSEFNVPGSGGFLTPSLTSAPTHVSFGHSLPAKSQDSKVVLRDNFTNTNGIQYFSNVKIIFCNRCGLGSEFNVPSEAMADSGSTVGFLAPPLTSAPNPVSFARSQSNKMDESCHPLWNKVSINPSKINPCRILIVLSIAVLVYLIHYKILHSVNDAYALPQWYASFYPFITADTILSTKEERRAIKREHEELKVSERVSGDGDGTSGPESVRDHHRMIQVPVSAVISNAPYLVNVDCGNYINSKAFFEAMYFMMDRQRYDRCSCRNVVLLDINIKGLDCNQGPIYVGTGCSLGGRQPMDMMPLLRKNAQRKTCNCWPKWCYLCCGSRIKNRKVKSILRKKIENNGNTRQIHAVGNIEGNEKKNHSRRQLWLRR